MIYLKTRFEFWITVFNNEQRFIYNPEILTRNRQHPPINLPPRLQNNAESIRNARGVKQHCSVGDEGGLFYLITINEQKKTKMTESVISFLCQDCNGTLF